MTRHRRPDDEESVVAQAVTDEYGTLPKEVVRQDLELFEQAGLMKSWIGQDGERRWTLADGVTDEDGQAWLEARARRGEHHEHAQAPPR